jgi:nucleoside-diphosphate-sugar epimerase
VTGGAGFIGSQIVAVLNAREPFTSLESGIAACAACWEI